MKSIDIILLRIITSVWAFLTLPPQGLSLTLLSVEDIWKPKVRNPMKMVDCVKIRNTLELRSWSQSWPAFQLLERKELSTCWEAPWNSQSVPLSTSCNYISQRAFFHQNQLMCYIHLIRLLIPGRSATLAKPPTPKSRIGLCRKNSWKKKQKWGENPRKSFTKT